MNIVIEPSAVVGTKSGRGVFVLVADQFGENADTPSSAEELMEDLAKKFEASLERSQGIVDQIMSLAETARG